MLLPERLDRLSFRPDGRSAGRLSAHRSDLRVYHTSKLRQQHALPESSDANRITDQLGAFISESA